jgi:hypothetical protein
MTVEIITVEAAGNMTPTNDKINWMKQYVQQKYHGAAPIYQTGQDLQSRKSGKKFLNKNDFRGSYLCYTVDI